MLALHLIAFADGSGIPPIHRKKRKKGTSQAVDMNM
jgi:hypothetical protein